MRSLILILMTVLSVAIFPANRAYAASSTMWQLWQQGNIASAARIARTSIHSDPDSAYHMLMLTSFVQGEFREAIDYQKIISPSYRRFQETLIPAIDAYRHLGLYLQAYNFAVRQKVNSPQGLQEALKESASNLPEFQLAQTTEIEFKTDDPYNPYLPAFNIKVNGTPLIGHLDTGGTFLVISKELADQMGIKYTFFSKGHCNGRDATVWFARTSFELGALSVKDLPVEISDCLDGTAMKDRAIFGTNLLQRFLTTIDYSKQRLVLSPFSRRAEHLRLVSKGHSTVARQKFHIWGDHYMFTKGQISGFKNLNFFVDTGLVYFHADGRQAAFLTSTENLVKMGYDRSVLDGSKVVDITGNVGLKKIVQNNHAVEHEEKIVFGDFGGVNITGLIAHAFLSKYSWTIDFERMSYTFRQ